mmetsp:Transcript_42494/g.79566  ORF Transcript_42494/g.79566 Transcript_42494/m.79566 type:complete len:208 (+) Transcript_42494:3231-3854(+)
MIHPNVQQHHADGDAGNSPVPFPPSDHLTQPLSGEGIDGKRRDDEEPDGRNKEYKEPRHLMQLHWSTLLHLRHARCRCQQARRGNGIRLERLAHRVALHNEDLLGSGNRAHLHQPRHVQLDKFVHLRMSDHEPYIQKLQRALQVFVYPVDRHCELDQRVVGIATCDVPQTIWGDGAARFAQRALQVVHALEGLLREVHLADHALIAL